MERERRPRLVESLAEVKAERNPRRIGLYPGQFYRKHWILVYTRDDRRETLSVVEGGGR